jgi:hypothetical protein
MIGSLWFGSESWLLSSYNERTDQDLAVNIAGVQQKEKCLSKNEPKHATCEEQEGGQEVPRAISSDYRVHSMK